MRHGEPVRGGDDPLDPELSAMGRAQTRAAVPYVQSAGFVAVYSSPQRRARETARVVAEALGRPVVFDDGLVEFDHGAPYVHYDGGEASVWRNYLAGDLSPWGLSRETFHARIAETMRRLVDRHRGQRVLAVSHGGVINAWTCQVFGMLDRLRVIEPAYASFHRYVCDGGDRWRVVSLNEVPACRPCKLDE